MALYCTHNSSFPLFDVFFWGGEGGEKQALALHGSVSELLILPGDQTR